MKKVLLFFSILLIAGACRESKKDNFMIEGSVTRADYEGMNVYLQEGDGMSNFTTVDSATIVNGMFWFEGIASNQPAVRYIQFERMVRPSLVVLEQGNITIDFDSIFTPVIRGTSINNDYQKIRANGDSIMQQIFSINDELYALDSKEQITKEKYLEIKSRRDKMRDEMQKNLSLFIQNNAGNTVGENLVSNLFEYIVPSKRTELISLFPAEFKDKESTKELVHYLSRYEATSEGKAFTNIKGFDLSGKPMELSNHVGKGRLVLVYFWASWSKPSLLEIPEIQKLHNQYRSKAFDVVSISMDEDKESWAKASSDLKIGWPQFSNLKGPELDQAAISYGVKRLPTMILIDENGTIIARDIQALDLKYTLQELLK